ncbi:MAG: glycerophosphodiester phosphodiesterase [Clostridia bacterium]|nr:glycerophosphodiester phosphodiesterase [Clostridia bacterium]
MLIIGHRGASGTAPENTLSAFRQAATLGAGMVELDVQLSADGVPVVIHDETLERTTTGSGYVRDYTLDQLQALDAGTWLAPEYKGEKIPALHEVITDLPSEMLINIELKNNLIPYPDLEAKVIRLVDELDVVERVVISSFNHESMARFRKMAPHLASGLLYEQPLDNPLGMAGELEVQTLHPHYSLVTPELVRAAHREGYLVYTWTVNQEPLMEKMIELGVDGVMTNYPANLARLLKNFV